MAARTTPTTAPAFLAPALTLPPQETLRLLTACCPLAVLAHRCCGLVANIQPFSLLLRDITVIVVEGEHLLCPWRWCILIVTPVVAVVTLRNEIIHL